MTEAIEDIGLDWEVAVRNGDTPQQERRKQERSMPDILITTPETLHLLFSQKKNSKWCVEKKKLNKVLPNKQLGSRWLKQGNLHYFYE